MRQLQGNYNIPLFLISDMSVFSGLSIVHVLSSNYNRTSKLANFMLHSLVLVKLVLTLFL